MDCRAEMNNVLWQLKSERKRTAELRLLVADMRKVMHELEDELTAARDLLKQIEDIAKKCLTEK